MEVELTGIRRLIGRPSRKGQWKFFDATCLPDSCWENWDALNSQYFDNHPLLSSILARELIQQSADGVPLVLAELYREGAVSAMAILVRDRGNRWSAFSPPQAPLSMVLIDPTVPLVDELTRELLSELPGYALSLTVPAEDPAVPGERLGAKPYVHRVSLGTTITVTGAEGFESYWNGRSRSLKQNVRRYFKRVEQDGLRCEMKHWSTPDEVGAAVDRYGVLESQGWKGRDGTALHPDNSQGHFYRGVMKSFARLGGNASAYELYVGEELVASRLVISGPSMHVMIKTTFSESLRQYAPGRLLLHMTLADLLASPNVRSVEFYTRANDDLKAWATSTRELYAKTVYRNAGVKLAALMRRRFLTSRRSVAESR